MGIRFAVVKLSAYAELVDELLLERNVFAWVTAAHLLARQTRRFGALSPTVQKRLAKASPEQLARWGEAVLDAKTLKQVFSARS